MIHRWCVVPVLALAVAACGGGAPGEGDDPASTPQAPVATPAGAGGGADGGTADAPVVVTVDGTPYAYPIGTCDVGSEHLVVSAGLEAGGFGAVEVTWAAGYEGDAQYQRFSAFNASADSTAPAPFELYADPGRPGTSWEVTVDGTTATVAATMVDELPANANPDNPVYREVTIAVRCDERGFGGMAPGPAFSPEAPPAGEVPTTAPAGAAEVVVTVDGTPHDFDVADCPISDAGVALNASDGAGGLIFISGGPTAYDLFVAFGDGTAFESSGIALEVGDREASWSGTMAAVGGGDAAVEIAIACP